MHTVSQQHEHESTRAYAADHHVHAIMTYGAANMMNRVRFPCGNSRTITPRISSAEAPTPTQHEEATYDCHHTHTEYSQEWWEVRFCSRCCVVAISPDVSCFVHDVHTSFPCFVVLVVMESMQLMSTAVTNVYTGLVSRIHFSACTYT